MGAFPRAARLLNKKDFGGVFGSPDYRASTRCGLVLANPGEHGQSRLGLVIAKKHVRHAVQRNRIKRIAREYFRTHELPVHCDVVFLARPKLGELTNGELVSTLNSLWSKLSKQITAP